MEKPELSFDDSNGVISQTYAKFLQETQQSTGHKSDNPPVAAAGVIPAWLTAQILFGEAAPPLAQQVDAFQKEHRVDISNQNGKFVYSLHVDGQNRMLFQTDASAAGLKEGQSKMNGLVKAEESELSKDFKVSFAKAGDDVDYQKADPDGAASSHMVKAREPELYELEGIKAALKQSLPSNIGTNGRGVKFYCLTEKQITGLDPLATFQMDRSGNPSVYMWPSIANVTRITEADLTEKERKMSWTDRQRPDSLEQAIVHELGHHNFAKLGYNAGAQVSEVDRDLSPKGEALVKSMGWLRRTDEKDADYNWFIVGKHKDQNGNSASYYPMSGGFFFSFMRRQQSGGIVDSSGKVVPADKGQSLSEDQMRKEALVTPPTWYFEAPEEEYAESVKLFRLGGDNRKYLQQDSTQLYNLIKTNDQSEIDAAYGHNADGSAKMIRDIDGQLVENTPVNRKRVQAFEQSK